MPHLVCCFRRPGAALPFLLLPLLAVFLFSPATSLADNSNNAGAFTGIPRTLLELNPVVRLQLRQRLEKLKLQKEAWLRRRPSSSSSGQSTAFPGGGRELSIGPNQLHHRNCFFSPINCHLPVIARRHRTEKRTAENRRKAWTAEEREEENGKMGSRETE